MAVTILDIAKAAGTSFPTVSRALNDNPKVNEATKRRIKKIAEDMGYFPSRMGVALKKGKTNTIGVLLPEVQNPFYADMLSSLKKAANKNGYNVAAFTFGYNQEEELKCLESMLGGWCDGVITSLMSFSYVTDVLKKMWQTKLPCVVIGPPQDMDEPFCDSVCGGVTYHKGQTLLEHLISLGHTDICHTHCQWWDNGQNFVLEQISQERERAGLSIDESRDFAVVKIEDADGRLSDLGYKCGKEILSRKERPTAIIGYNDYFATGIIRAALDMGLKIPEDVSISGRDNTWLGEIYPVSITTIDQHLEEMADLAFKLLLSRMESEDWLSSRQETVGSELVIRESTGPVAS